MDMPDRMAFRNLSEGIAATPLAFLSATDNAVMSSWFTKTLPANGLEVPIMQLSSSC